MSGPTIRFSEATVIPEVSIAADVGNTLEITNIDDFDLGLLGNKQKIGVSTPPRTQSPGIKDVSSNNHNDGIEFVNLEDTNSTFQVKPPAGGDTIRIVRDAPAPVKVVEEAPFALKSGPSTSAFQPIRPQTPAPAPATAVPDATGSSATAAAAADPPKSWFSNITGSSTNKTSSSWFGGSGSAAPAPAAAALPEKTEYLTPEQEAIKKTESLTMLERMDRRGIGGNKMSMMNSYEEIQAELSKRKDSKALEASLRFQRSMLTTVTNGMEFLNNRYDPLGVNLDGWSEQINENLEDYDEIFEELYDKYKDRSKVAPEVRLIMSLGLSAAMCHVTNTMFKSRMPGMDDILRKNPDLAKQMAQAAAEQAVGPGFANFVSLGMGSRGQPQQQQQAPAAFNSASEERYTSVRAPTPPPVPTARREMRGPTGVDDIIEKLNNAGENHSQRSVPNIDAEEIASVGSGMTTNTMRRQGLSSRRRTTAQPTGSVLTLNV